MAIEFFDGFDHYVSAATGPTGIHGGGWVKPGLDTTHSIVAGRFAGSNAVQITGNGPAGTAGRGLLSKARVTPGVAFSVAVASLFTADRVVAIVLGVGSGMAESSCGLKIRHNENGQLQLARRTGPGVTDHVILAETPHWTVFIQQWNHYSMWGTIGANGSLYVALNGVLLWEFDDIDTRSSLNMTQVSYAHLCSSYDTSTGTPTCQWDDFVMGNTAEQIPDSRVFPRYPVSDAANTGFTPSTGATLYGCVDEAQISTTDYIQASAPGDNCEFGLTPMPYEPKQVLSVAVRAQASKSDAATRVIKFGVKTGTGTIVEGDDLGLSTATSPYRVQIDDNPDTSADWTRADLDALRLRAHVTV